ncbi:hypothetical protein HAX54_027949 [Datura stramonium]|uniref:Uncharacterized protein n=1 Tax=Datura stramonium TaxID=4076 RepID=A0ABS8V652_DATST|nr:hypothetical protein [Datura stramonium]
MTSKAFKKAMKATWGKTSDEKSKREDAFNGGSIFFRCGKKGMVVCIGSVHELKNSGGTNPETVVSSEEGIDEGIMPDFVPGTNNEESQELNLRPWKHQSSHPLDFNHN